MEVREWLLKVGIEAVHEFCPFEFRKYFDVAKATAITDAAIAKMDLGDRTAHLVLEGEPDGPKTVSMIFDKPVDQEPKPKAKRKKKK